MVLLRFRGRKGAIFEGSVLGLERHEVVTGTAGSTGMERNRSCFDGFVAEVDFEFAAVARGGGPRASAISLSTPATVGIGNGEA